MLNGLLRAALRKLVVRFAWTRPWKRGCAISSPRPFPCIQLQEGHGRGLSGSRCWAGIPRHASGSRRSHCGVTWIFRVLKIGQRPGITMVPRVAVPPPKLIPMIMLATLAEPGWSKRLRAAGAPAAAARELFVPRRASEQARVEEVMFNEINDQTRPVGLSRGRQVVGGRSSGRTRGTDQQKGSGNPMGSQDPARCWRGFADVAGKLGQGRHHVLP